MTDTTELTRRYAATSAAAGWVSLTGFILVFAGIAAQVNWLPARFVFCLPVGIAGLILGGVVAVGADELASRYQAPDEDGNQ